MSKSVRHKSCIVRQNDVSAYFYEIVSLMLSNNALEPTPAPDNGPFHCNNALNRGGTVKYGKIFLLVRDKIVFISFV